MGGSLLSGRYTAPHQDRSLMPFQKTITLARRAKGCHLVTDEVVGQIKEGLQGVDIGIAHFFIQHTSAALSINENYDSDVRKDMDMALDHIVPETLKWKHTDEGLFKHSPTFTPRSARNISSHHSLC